MKNKANNIFFLQYKFEPNSTRHAQNHRMAQHNGFKISVIIEQNFEAKYQTIYIKWFK
jgi:hypothetical protein